MFHFGKHAPQTKQECTHPHPTPRWENMEDVGRSDRAARLYCSACNHFLPPTESVPAQGPKVA